jgi:hypothetical protein
MRFISQPLPRNILPVVETSSSAGYMTSPGLDFGMSYFEPFDGSGNVTVPNGFSVMISFPMFNILGTLTVTVYEDDSAHATNSNKKLQVLSSWSESTFKPMPAMVYSKARLISVRLHLDHKYLMHIEMGSFKMLYSFRTPSNTPQLLAKGVFNCSVDFYGEFKHHLHCNLQRECIYGEDETGWWRFCFTILQ